MKAYCHSWTFSTSNIYTYPLQEMHFPSWNNSLGWKLFVCQWWGLSPFSPKMKREHCLIFVLKTAGCHVQYPALPPSSLFCGCYALIFPLYPGECKCNKVMRNRAESKVRHSMIPQAVSPIHILQLKTAGNYIVSRQLFLLFSKFNESSFDLHSTLATLCKLIDTWWLEPSEFSLL